MSEEPSSDIQLEISAGTDYIRNANKERPVTEAIYKYISRRKASNVSLADIVNSINEFVKPLSASVALT